MQRGNPKVVNRIFQEQEINRHVGTRIRERRVMLGLTQQQIAELIGVTFQQEYKYEDGLNLSTTGMHFSAKARSFTSSPAPAWVSYSWAPLAPVGSSHRITSSR